MKTGDSNIINPITFYDTLTNHVKFQTLFCFALSYVILNESNLQKCSSKLISFLELFGMNSLKKYNQINFNTYNKYILKS